MINSSRMCWLLLHFAACVILLAATVLASSEAENLLHDPDPKVRERAIKDLAQEDEPANVPTIAALVQDTDENVRMAVVKALIHLGSPAVLPPLLKAVQDGIPEIRHLAIDGLINFYVPGYVDIGFGGFFRNVTSKVEALFSDVDTAVIEQDVSPDSDVIRTLSLAVNGAPDMNTRARAARALGIMRSHEAIPELLKAAFSNNVDLILASLVAFEKIKDPSIGPRLTFLLKYPQETVQEAAASTLGVLRAEAAIPDLQQMFHNSVDDKGVRAAALDALAFMPNKDTAPLFTKYLYDKEKKLRASSALGLGRLEDPSYAEALLKARQTEKDASVRLALDFALVKTGKMESIRPLVSSLTSRVHRGEARPYLIELARDKIVRGALRPYLFSKQPDIRQNLCTVYGASGDASSIPDLEVLLRDRKPNVSDEASRAIRLIRSRT
ncbi:MAG: HEAT repeat domain-containing protein [Acidobacteria bacterium]|nr:HEAT repeat domain-containing protein [Acidobacteriota bacterium]